jgi:hypothetical protein
MARDDQDIILSVYSIHGHGDHALLGKTKENITRMRANGNGNFLFFES